MKLRRSRSESATQLKAVDALVERGRSTDMEFDPRLDISEEQWERLIGNLESLRDVSVGAYMSMAWPLAVMRPDIKAKIAKDDVVFNDCRQVIINERYNGDRGTLTMVAAACHIFSDRRSELGLEEDDYTIYNSYFNPDIEDEKDLFCAAAVEVLQIYPEERIEFIELNEKYEGILELLKKYRDEAATHQALMLARNMLMVYPDKRVEILTHAPSIEEGAEYLRTYVSDSMWHYGNIASALTIMSADEVRISKNGVELFMREGLTETPELPDRNLVA